MKMRRSDCLAGDSFTQSTERQVLMKRQLHYSIRNRDVVLVSSNASVVLERAGEMSR